MQHLGRFAPRDLYACPELIRMSRGRGNTLNRHRPRRRAIQYSETPMMESRNRSVLDTPLSRSMTVGICVGCLKKSRTCAAKGGLCSPTGGEARGQLIQHPLVVGAVERKGRHVD